MSGFDDVPESVEEAGALLGASITRCGVISQSTVVPPKGMPSSFATISPVPSAELFLRLTSLRALLRSAPDIKGTPLQAAPSLLAVLMKLLGVSNSTGSAKTGRTPPMLSTPLRKIWVDCIVLCHRLGNGLAGNARIDIYAYVRTMMVLAGTNPKSAKAAGGIRIAALDVMAALFADDQLAIRLAPWALDVLELCHRGLKSSGNGEPSHRIACVHTAISVALACRIQGSHNKSTNSSTFITRGAMEDRAISELVKLLRQAVCDKFPEVRSAAATLAGMAAPVLLLNTPDPSNSSGSSQSAKNDSLSPTASLDDVLVIALRNMDDESVGVATGWSEALARLLCTSIEYGNTLRSNASERNASSRHADTPSDGAKSLATNKSSRKPGGMASQCASLKATVQYLVDHFVKVGGELAASRGGSSFSIGGRAVRIGVSLAMVKLLNLQSENGNIGQGRDMQMTEVIHSVLNMMGPDILKQLRLPELAGVTNLDATSAQFATTEKPSSSLSTSLFSSGRYKSHADAGLARLATGRVLRQGLSESVSEPTQLSILHDLIKVCSLGGDVEKFNDDEAEQMFVAKQLNAHQLQVALIEVSHLLTTLGEAAASCIEDLVPALQACLVHAEHGVRHEAAIACSAMTCSFATEGRNIFLSSVSDMQLHHAELVTLDRMRMEDGTPEPRKRRFGRSPGKQTVDESLSHQYAIHGHALLISMLLRELPHLPGGLPTELLSTALSVAEIMVSCQYNNVMTKMNPGAACTCVRAGYGVVSGALTSGAVAITPHIALVFGLWQKSGKSAESGAKHFSTDHDLICLDAALSSIVAFLTHCSELLLAVPDALSRTTSILEEMLPLFLPDGRLGTTPLNPAAASRHESAKASIMEAFAWLPPGSFPMVSDNVFEFAATHIQSGTEEDVICSILPTLVSNEDHLLDGKSFSRAKTHVQVGGARDVEENLVALTSEAAHHGERESVMHFRHKKARKDITDEFTGSQILGLFASDQNASGPPTALHSVGKWTEPVSPSRSSKVRLIDAAVQVFSATFGMKDSREQMTAMGMLEALVPPFLTQLARVIGVNTALIEPERRSKTKEELAGVANICAVLLACLEALPTHDATHNIRIGLGPPWMNKAKDLLLILLPSTSNIVRRAAAEGLALLATLGVSQDAHTLQSAVLHSLDEVMQGNQPDGKARALPLESVSGARAASLLTLACIQRTASNIKKKQEAKSQEQLSRSYDRDQLLDDTLPTMQMMTRILPSLVCSGRLRDSFVVKTYALHSFGLLIAYSTRFDKPSLCVEDEHLVRKAVEAIEDNFLDSWTSASSVFDRGQETEKLTAEPAFLSVLLRLMTFLLPALHLLKSADPTIALRFSGMASMILELYGSHPMVTMEGMAFFERLSAFQHLLPDPSANVKRTENALFYCVTFLKTCITPDRPPLLVGSEWQQKKGCLSSTVGKRTAVLCVKLLSSFQTMFSNADEIVSMLFALLEVTCGSRRFAGAEIYRSIAGPREAEQTNSDHILLETGIIDCLESMLLSEKSVPANVAKTLLHWVLLARSLLVGNTKKTGGDDIESNAIGTYTVTDIVQNARDFAENEASLVLQYGSPSRWQVKCLAAKIATLALQEIATMCQASGIAIKDSPHFNPAAAIAACQESCLGTQRRDSNLSPFVSTPSSYVILHLRELITAACASAVATVDNSELFQLQEGGLQLLKSLVTYIGSVFDPKQTDVSILEEYSSQIFSSIKHALVSLDETDGEPSYRLFSSGCEALELIIGKGLITDAMVVKRMVRPVIPSAEEIVFSSFNSDSLSCPFRPKKLESLENHREALLPRIGKLWTVSKLQTIVDKGVVSEPVSTPIIGELQKFKKELGVHCAAIALDGVRLLLGNGLTLVGGASSTANSASENEMQQPHEQIPFDAGLTYANLQNIDDYTKFALVQAWPACACNAVASLVEFVTTEGVDKKLIADTQLWLEKLVPAMFAGLHEALSDIELVVDEGNPVPWCRRLSVKETAESCMHGICILAKHGSLLGIPSQEFGLAINHISTSIFFPALGMDKDFTSASNEEEKERIPVFTVEDVGLVTEACHLLEILASSDLLLDDATLTTSLLEPLKAMQNQEIKFDRTYAAKILESCLRGVRHLTRKSNAEGTMVKAMLQLSLQVLSPSSAFPCSLKAPSAALLRDCLEHKSISNPEHSLLARKMARDGNWGAWAIICDRSEDGSGMQHSLENVQKALYDYEQNATVLAAVRGLVQTAPANGPLVGSILHGVGAQVLLLLKIYGTFSLSSIGASKNAVEHRMAACTDAMKIAMAAFQHLTSDVDQQMTSFLSLLFEVLVDIIVFNGLPNHPSRTRSAAVEPALGRMSAQAAVHVARTAPASFKASMANLSDQGRAVFEMAVRAEMTGYVVQAQEPTKKKLSLKGFKR